MKTVEELLVQRYKVIADYPGNKFQIGDVLTYVKEIAQSYDLWVNQDGLQITYNHFGKYPHLFQPLPWWSDRRLHELPEYVKCIKTPDQRIMPGMVLKMAWCNENWGNDHVHTVVLDTNCYVPATREEYELFKQNENP